MSDKQPTIMLVDLPLPEPRYRLEQLRAMLDSAEMRGLPVVPLTPSPLSAIKVAIVFFTLVHDPLTERDISLESNALERNRKEQNPLKRKRNRKKKRR